VTSFENTLALCAWLGWGLATSPLPLVALAVMLLNKNPVRAGLAFTGSWFLFQLIAVLVISPLVMRLLSIKMTASQKHVVGWAGVILGTALVVVAVLTWWRERGETNSNQAAKARALIDKAASADVRQAVYLGFFFTLLNVTNVAYWAGVGLFLHRSGLPQDERFEIIFLTALVASSTFIVVTLLVFAFPRQIRPWLDHARNFVLKHSGSILPGLFLVAGLTLLAVGTRDLGLWR